jgi:hypothetical protein
VPSGKQHYQIGKIPTESGNLSPSESFLEENSLKFPSLDPKKPENVEMGNSSLIILGSCLPEYSESYPKSIEIHSNIENLKNSIDQEDFRNEKTLKPNSIDKVNINQDTNNQEYSNKVK